MKYVIIRCEDYAPGRQDTAALLEGAKTSHLQQLAQAGAAGLVHRRADDPLIDRFECHRAFFGLEPGDLEAAPARCYAEEMRVQLAPSETAWCCEFVTHQDGTIIDPVAGHIPTKESEVLVRALNSQLGSETRRWEIGSGSHHLLVVSDASLDVDDKARPQAPELLVGREWVQSLPKGSLREPLQRVIEEASTVLESQTVNRVRVDLGENPANMLWLWGAAHGQSQRTLTERTGLTGALLSNNFPMRGFASCLGLDWNSGARTFEERALQQLMKGVAALVERRDLVYVHLRIESADPVDRLCAMERIDQMLLKPLTALLPRRDAWRLLVAIDDRRTGSVPFVAIGTGLPARPVTHVDAATLAQSGQPFEDARGLFSWFIT